jgi:FkbM family methyltransferase
MNTCKTILGFKYCGEIKNAELAYAWCRGQIPEHNDLALVSCFFPYINNFFDIGANSGSYCVLASALGKGRIKSYAFEPQKKCVDDLRATAIANGWEDTLNIYEVALSNKTGIEKIYFDKNVSTGTSFVNKDSGNYFEIETLTFDNFCKNNTIESVDFIKIDVEGFELEVLEGGKNIITNASPAIFIEILNNTASKEKSINFLREQGYKLYIFQNNKLIEFEGNQEFRNIDMYLCLKEKHNEILNHVQNLLSNNNLLYEPFRQSSLPAYSKVINFNLLKMRYFLRSFLK